MVKRERKKTCMAIYQRIQSCTNIEFKSKCKTHSFLWHRIDSGMPEKKENPFRRNSREITLLFLGRCEMWTLCVKQSQLLVKSCWNALCRTWHGRVSAVAAYQIYIYICIEYTWAHLHTHTHTLIRIHKRTDIESSGIIDELNARWDVRFIWSQLLLFCAISCVI